MGHKNTIIIGSSLLRLKIIKEQLTIIKFDQ